MYNPELLGYCDKILYQIKGNDIIQLDMKRSKLSTIKIRYRSGPTIRLVDTRFLKRLGLGDGNLLSN